MLRSTIDDHEMTMSDMDRILCSTYVMESSRDIELEMYKDRVKQLCQLLLNAQQERDEARQQVSELKKLLNTYMPSSTSNHTQKVPTTEPLILDEQQISRSGFVNYVFSPNSSTPTDCISDATNNSPALSNASLGTGCLSSYNLGRVRTRTTWSNELMLDHTSIVIDNLVKGKALPEKGKLVEAVANAEPLLEKLILTGHIPRWRNPPTLPSLRAPIPDSVSSQYQRFLEHQSLRGSRFQ